MNFLLAPFRLGRSVFRLYRNWVENAPLLIVGGTMAVSAALGATYDGFARKTPGVLGIVWILFLATFGLAILAWSLAMRERRGHFASIAWAGLVLLLSCGLLASSFFFVDLEVASFVVAVMVLLGCVGIADAQRREEAQAIKAWFMRVVLRKKT